VILDCDRLWTRFVTVVYRLRRLPRVTNDPPAVERKVRRVEADPRAESSVEVDVDRLRT
jgi:hypothetical protein